VGEAHWLEISLIVEGEIAEAAAEVLARYIPDGVVIESTAVEADAEDVGRVVGPLRVCGYLPLTPDLEETRRKIEEGLWYLGRISPIPTPSFRQIAEVNWVEAWKEHYHPIPIGEKLLILPAWIDEFPPERTAIRIEPGMAFGTGTHPTTQLCLALAERWVHPGEPVIDIGCGSGILAIGALKLGASYALGVDIDPEAVDSSRQNALLNDVLHKLELGTGSVVDVLAGKFTLHQAPLVFANILAPIIIRLFNEGLAELLSPGGALVLSGILAEQEDSVMLAAQTHHLSLQERLQINDWVALCFIPSVPGNPTT
jgi:ribosomal protein L11 methyltransferase